MEDPEKRGRSVVARRQQQQQQQYTTSTTNTMAKNKSSQHRAKGKMSDFMLGVATGLSARNNNLGLISSGLGQAAASSGTVLPTHLDFSFRDRNDVSAKRRFQVKIPCRLMAILTLVFLIVPGLIFLHKEMHIHEDQYTSHFRTEKYVNVDTKGVWDNFRSATVEETVDHRIGQDTITTQQQSKLKEDYPGEANADSNDSALMDAKNQTKAFSTIVDRDIIEVEIHGDARDGEKLSYDSELSTEVKSVSSDKEKHLTKFATKLSNATSLVQNRNDEIGTENRNKHEITEAKSNSTATNEMSNEV